MATAIFYASSTGNTETAANNIASELGVETVLELSNATIDKITDYDKVILGASTWGEGDLQDDWERFWDDFSKVDFSGKTVALFGLGDQDTYDEYFLDAMGIIYDKVVENGANVIGEWELDDYEFEESKALRDGKFVGLGLDEDNQFDLSEERISTWCDQIRGDIL